MYPIVSDVVVPKALRAQSTRRRKYPFADLEAGQMFFVPDRKVNNMSAHASTVGKELGRKFHTQMTYMRLTKKVWRPCDPEAGGAVLGIGVWRVK